MKLRNLELQLKIEVKALEHFFFSSYRNTLDVFEGNHVDPFNLKNQSFPCKVSELTQNLNFSHE